MIYNEFLLFVNLLLFLLLRANVNIAAILEAKI